MLCRMLNEFKIERKIMVRYKTQISLLPQPVDVGLIIENKTKSNANLKQKT